MRGEIKGGFQWGAGLEFLPNEDYGIELLYFHQDTKSPITYEYSNDMGTREVELGVNYIMAGGVRYINAAAGRLQLYGGLLLGAVIFSNKTPQDNEERSYVKFGWGARLGLNFLATEKVGLKLQAHLLSAVQSFGGGLSFGTSGAGVGVSSYSTLMQFGIGGGLCFKVNAP